MKFNKNLKRIELQTIRSFNNSLFHDNSTIDCSIGDPPYDTNPLIKQEAVESILGSDSHYCDARGFRDLREKIHNQNPMYLPEEILITAGASEALASTLMALIEPNDVVILVKPIFPLYITLLQLLGAKIIELETLDTAWQIQPENLMSYVGNQIKAIIINTPNNPTGIIYNQQSIDAITEFVQANDCWCIVDEVYKDYSFRPFISLTQSAKISHRLITIRSFSKSYFMCGYRLGYIMAKNNIINEILKVHQSVMTSLPLFIQKAGFKALDLSTSIQKEKIKRKRTLVYEELIKSNVEVVLSDGGFYLFFKIKGITDNSRFFCEKCAEHAKVIMTPGYFFHQEGFVRISVLAEEAVLKEAMRRIKKYLKEIWNTEQSENQEENAGDK